MTDKKNEELKDEEIAKASGGAGYSLSAKKLANRSPMSPGGTSGTAPGGPGGSKVANREELDPEVKP